MTETTNNTEKHVKFLVVDSSVLIRRAPIKDLTDIVYSVPGVVNEIRDVNTRASLQVLPYEFKLKEPTHDACKFIGDFSRKTGDYSNLSAVDLQLLALTYQLCKENFTTEEFSKLKLEPSKSMLRVDTNQLKLDKPVSIAGFYLPPKKTSKDKNETENSLDESLKNLEINEKEDKNNNELNESDKNLKTDELDEEKANEANNEEDESEDEDEIGWITPSNLEEVKKMNLNELEEDISHLSVKVACMTSDFAMQNVLIQIGIPVLSVDGLLIRKARSYVLKCITCSKITTNMSKEFCPICGYKTLDRVVVTVDSDGNKTYRERRFPKSTKGLRFSLPMPRGGKHSNYPILSEDQPRAQNLPPKKALVKNNPLDPDYICQSSPFVTKDVYSKASRLGNTVKSRFNKRS